MAFRVIAKPMLTGACSSRLALASHMPKSTWMAISSRSYSALLASPTHSQTTFVSPTSMRSTSAILRQTTALRTFQTSDKNTQAYPESVPVHPPNHAEGSYHWDFERALSVALIPIIGAQAVYGAHPITDLLLGVVLPLHCHIGWGAMVTDYVPTRRMPRMNKLCTWSLRTFTVLTLLGCYQFNTNDVGLTELIKRVWKA
ncbi:membrane anchor subunit of succinate dehydrogenase, Sdh4 [Dispira simplex]|nr:membrane anchor subunit of succinate dehydrogenase, Sdh4 [Dispira simplex]